MKALLVGLAVVLLGSVARAGEPPPPPAPVMPDPAFETLSLDSPYLAGPVKVEVLRPDKLEAGKTYPVLYILPPVATGTAFGSGLTEAKKADIANKYGIICVYSAMTGHPWFGNHATDPKYRQDDYVVKSLVPFIDGKFPTQKNAEGRWLLGFSKSGWGALTLLFRHPDTFGYAAAWDVPFMLNGDNWKTKGKPEWGPMGLAENMGTKETMQQFLPTKLATDNVAWLKGRCRLVIGDGKFWKGDNEKFHAYLEQAGIPHVWLPDVQFEHRWDSGWFAPEVEELVKIARMPMPMK